MPTTTIDDREFWSSVEKIAKTVDNWPDWKKEGWAVLDKRDSTDFLTTSFEENKSSKISPKSTKTSFE